MFILANYDVVSIHYYVNGFSIGRGIASGGERVTDCKGPRGLGGPRSPTGHQEHGHREWTSIRVVARSQKRGRPPRYYALFLNYSACETAYIYLL